MPTLARISTERPASPWNSTPEKCAYVSGASRCTRVPPDGSSESPVMRRTSASCPLKSVAVTTTSAPSSHATSTARSKLAFPGWAVTPSATHEVPTGLPRAMRVPVTAIMPASIISPSFPRVYPGFSRGLAPWIPASLPLVPATVMVAVPLKGPWMLPWESRSAMIMLPPLISMYTALSEIAWVELTTRMPSMTSFPSIGVSMSRITFFQLGIQTLSNSDGIGLLHCWDSLTL
mmetsp:Transcript_3862/g.9232  ORF Transcript_3862/g.9232 Transcript_3862/m.9232 type:complete len:233 (-) Transcript_3862:95-793(-)